MKSNKKPQLAAGVNMNSIVFTYYKTISHPAEANTYEVVVGVQGYG